MWQSTLVFWGLLQTYLGWFGSWLRLRNQIAQLRDEKPQSLEKVLDSTSNLDKGWQTLEDVIFFFPIFSFYFLTCSFFPYFSHFPIDECNYAYLSYPWFSFLDIFETSVGPPKTRNLSEHFEHFMSPSSSQVMRFNKCRGHSCGFRPTNLSHFPNA